MINTSSHIWPSGPYSAVRPGESVLPKQQPVESNGPEPVDEMVPSMGVPSSPTGRGPSISTQQMSSQAERSAGAALAGFPQIVHLLTNPELHFGQQISDETGLPVVSLGDATSYSDLEALLSKPEFAAGFILEGFPTDRAAAQSLDTLLSATNPNERRVLNLDDSQSAAHRDVVDHYIDQGLLWQVPSSDRPASSEQVKSSLMECLTGIPALR